MNDGSWTSGEEELGGRTEPILPRLRGGGDLTQNPNPFWRGTETSENEDFICYTWNPPFQIPPGRPIVSDCSSETHHTAEFIEFYWNPTNIPPT